ncbi:hypothetical protein FH972_024885 [Carpinus fangiana]|uniref:Phytocyanin domain-containing protein n=1 Tax=Carpinus fangiana TaxID=176857 RepID=A0A5N6L1W6_9ROSI|nr:hypothetical protein FH972_024885 [Carpinus fangiana]
MKSFSIALAFAAAAAAAPAATPSYLYTLVVDGFKGSNSSINGLHVQAANGRLVVAEPTVDLKVTFDPEDGSVYYKGNQHVYSNGTSGQTFYQKTATAPLPDHARVTGYQVSQDENKTYLVGHGTWFLCPFQSTAGPAYTVFELAPGGGAVDHTCSAARLSLEVSPA